MDHANLNEIDDVCRTCLSKSGRFKCIYDMNSTKISLANMIMSFTSVILSENDGLSGQICEECASQALIAYTFKEKCEETDSTLRSVAPKNITNTPSSLSLETREIIYVQPKVEVMDVEVKNENEELSMANEVMDSFYENLDNFSNKEDATEWNHAYENCTLSEVKLEEVKKKNKVKMKEVAENTLSNMLPHKSKRLYEKTFQQFMAWCEANKVVNVSEDVLLAYFTAESKNKKSSTLWCIYSKLRACLSLHKNLDISKYNKLQVFLKRQAEGYEAKKSKILEVEHIKKFITDANDTEYLLMKVVLIMGYSGACRREELIKMVLDDIECKQNAIIVSMPKTKTNMPRLFAITEESWIALINKYLKLRPEHVTHKRFLLTYRNGYCVNCPIGINTVAKIPRLIAQFLKLPNPEYFTGHCFRRSGATHLVNKGGDLITLKHYGRRKSSTVAEGHIKESLKKKLEIETFLPLEPIPPQVSFVQSVASTSTSSETKPTAHTEY